MYVGSEVTLGPYNLTLDLCKERCNTVTFESQECWAIAYMPENGENFCRLYFAMAPMTSEQKIASSENYTFYRKLYWKRML